MGIKIPICKNMKHMNIHTTKNIHTLTAVFIFIVILSSLIIYAKVGSISRRRPSLFFFIDKSHRYTHLFRLVFVCFDSCCNAIFNSRFLMRT